MELEINSILAFPQAESFKNIVADTLQLAAANGATQAEAGLSVSSGLSVATRMGSVETIEHQQDNGLGISVYVGQHKGSVSVLRKGKHKQLALEAEVYDYHSIHLLAASMGMQQLDRATVDFYRKGKITRSELVYGGTENLDIDGKAVTASIYQQVIVKSSSQLKYYYAAENPLLPLRLEKRKPGKSPVTMTLRKVEWDL